MRKARKITHMIGDVVIVTKKDWDEMWRRFQAGDAEGLRGGGGCEEWCENVCEGDDGCDLAAGSPGDCVALCLDGEVFLQV